jgi:epoxyqueuosine reductase
VNISDLIVLHAKDLGAGLAGVAALGDLVDAPSYTARSRMAPFGGVGSAEWADSDDEPSDPDPATVHKHSAAWPPEARSALVLALWHPAHEADLDWWGVSGGTRGNAALIRVAAALKETLAGELGLRAWDASYYPDRGGAFLKDAAVLAGLGTIGRNNLLVTPDFGPRIRLRLLFLEAELPSTGPLPWSPCEECDARCRDRCPQQAFRRRRYTVADLGLPELPGTDGTYDRELCNHQMGLDEEKAAVGGKSSEEGLVRYCRRCELSCPVGR